MKTPPPLHPAQFSHEILDAIVPALRALPRGSLVFDPYAGRGIRLAARCQLYGIRFAGVDIEQYEKSHPAVKLGDANDPAVYPAEPFVVITSPVYFGNRISSDYVNGPTPNTKTNGRRAYGISLGRALHPDNLARLCRRGRAPEYYAGHSPAVNLWGSRVIVNVDGPLYDGWRTLLEDAGYTIALTRCVKTPRYRGPDNSEVRAEYEVVIFATKGAG